MTPPGPPQSRTQRGPEPLLAGRPQPAPRRAGGNALRLEGPVSNGTLFAVASLLQYTGLEELDLSGLQLVWHA